MFSLLKSICSFMSQFHSWKEGEDKPDSKEKQILHEAQQFSGGMCMCVHCLLISWKNL